MAKKEPKTNAMRMLERAKIPFEVHRYECKEFIDGITIADMLRVFCICHSNRSGIRS